MEKVKTRKNLLGRTVTVRKSGKKTDDLGKYKVRTVYNPKTGETKTKTKTARNSKVANGTTIKVRGKGKAVEGPKGMTQRDRTKYVTKAKGAPAYKEVTRDTEIASPKMKNKMTGRDYREVSGTTSIRSKQRGKKASTETYKSERYNRNDY
jgi:hypothetical protein